MYWRWRRKGDLHEDEVVGARALVVHAGLCRLAEQCEGALCVGCAAAYSAMGTPAEAGGEASDHMIGLISTMRHHPA